MPPSCPTPPAPAARWRSHPKILSASGVQPHTLILGTAPSPMSDAIGLSAAAVGKRGGDGPQYYGNPSNHFFNIVGTGLEPGAFRRDTTPYAEQVRRLADAGYAVWDVLKEAAAKNKDGAGGGKSGGGRGTGSPGTRRTALDSDIDLGASVPNDIPRFVAQHPSITRLVFPQTAATIFVRYYQQWLLDGVWPTSGGGGGDGGGGDGGGGGRGEDEGIGGGVGGGDTSARMQGATAGAASVIDMAVVGACVDTATAAGARVSFFIAAGGPTERQTTNVFRKTGKLRKAVRLVDTEPQQPNSSSSSTSASTSAPTTTTATTAVRTLELIVLPSTSPAAASLRPAEKEKMWHIACFNHTETRAPASYVCACCGAAGAHWLVDCCKGGSNGEGGSDGSGDSHGDSSGDGDGGREGGGVGGHGGDGYDKWCSPSWILGGMNYAGYWYATKGGDGGGGTPGRKRGK